MAKAQAYLRATYEATKHVAAGFTRTHPKPTLRFAFCAAGLDGNMRCAIAIEGGTPEEIAQLGMGLERQYPTIQVETPSGQPTWAVLVPQGTVFDPGHRAFFEGGEALGMRWGAMKGGRCDMVAEVPMGQDVEEAKARMADSFARAGMDADLRLVRDFPWKGNVWVDLATAAQAR